MKLFPQFIQTGIHFFCAVEQIFGKTLETEIDYHRETKFKIVVKGALVAN